MRVREYRLYRMGCEHTVEETLIYLMNYRRVRCTHRKEQASYKFGVPQGTLSRLSAIHLVPQGTLSRLSAIHLVPQGTLSRLSAIHLVRAAHLTDIGRPECRDIAN